MHIDQANIYNLKNLWKKYGSETLSNFNRVTEVDLPEYHINLHWPHRCWLDDSIFLTDLSWTKNLPEAAILPVWPKLTGDKLSAQVLTEQSQFEKQLAQNNWYCMLEQTAMYLTLPFAAPNSASEAYQVQPRAGFTMKHVKTRQDVNLWVDIVSDAFGYIIDPAIIEKLLTDQEVQILMAYQNEQAVASALLYKMDDIIGLHQVGVKSDFQGKGLARTFMQELLVACISWQGKHIVLQASQAGKALYESLGFTPQFLIKSYRQG